jgi:hypothetical protein
VPLRGSLLNLLLVLLHVEEQFQLWMLQLLLLLGRRRIRPTALCPQGRPHQDRRGGNGALPLKLVLPR